VASAKDFGHPNAVIIPGTKSTIADLDWLNQVGLAEVVIRFAREGGAVVGICGGYQMLGETISDPDHVESNVTNTQGLGLLPIRTRFLAEKSTYQVSALIQRRVGWLDVVAGQRVTGYEIHMGESTVPGNWLEIRERNGQDVHILDGAMSKDGRIWGCYLHGIFANDAFRRAWLNGLGWQAVEQTSSHAESFNRSLNELADAVENSIDMNKLEKIIWES
jgi:adenosylcobyric acid synthase